MSECELPIFYEYAEPIAGKRHKCVECNAPIPKGEKHFHGWGKWDYGMASYRQHLVCMEACMMIRDDFNDGECIGFGELKEFFGEMKVGWLRNHKENEKWKRLRHLMAVILVRERKAKRDH